MIILMFWVLFAVMAGLWAKKQGKSGIAWFAIALFASPLVAFIFLAVMGTGRAASEGYRAGRAGFTRYRPDWRTTLIGCPLCRGSGENTLWTGEKDPEGGKCVLCLGKKRVTGEVAERYRTNLEQVLSGEAEAK